MEEEPVAPVSEVVQRVLIVIGGQRAGRATLLAKLEELNIAARELSVVMINGARRMAALCETMRITECYMPKLPTLPQRHYPTPKRTKDAHKGRKQPNLAPFWCQKPQKTGRKHR